VKKRGNKEEEEEEESNNDEVLLKMTGCRAGARHQSFFCFLL
jgi:hypothetical protein